MDPTRVRNQPALTTSKGGIWLVMGGLFTMICLGVIVPLALFAPGAWFAVVADLALYAVLVGARSFAPEGRRRLTIMAWAMIGIAVISLATTLVVAFTTLGK